MKRNADFMIQNVGGTNLLVPLGAQVKNMNGVVTLNDTAIFLWKLLAHEHSLEELAAAVAEKFDVDHETARTDVYNFVAEITGMGLLES